MLYDLWEHVSTVLPADVGTVRARSETRNLGEDDRVRGGRSGGGGEGKEERGKGEGKEKRGKGEGKEKRGKGRGEEEGGNGEGKGHVFATAFVPHLALG